MLYKTPSLMPSKTNAEMQNSLKLPVLPVTIKWEKLTDCKLVAAGFLTANDLVCQDYNDFFSMPGKIALDIEC